MNILIAVDKNYIEKAETMLFSLRIHTKEDIIVYLLNSSLSGNEVKNFADNLLKKSNIQLKEIKVKEDIFSSLDVGVSHFSCVEMYYRILAQFLLPNTIDRILWLDADMIILKDITDFYYQSFEENAYIVCEDAQNGREVVERKKRHLHLPKEYKYFNSGALLINMCYLRERTTQEEILAVSENLQDKIECPDQDILNYLYRDRVKYADWKCYNYQVYDPLIPDNEKDNIAILHYAGDKKPWDYWHINSASKYYWEIRARQGHKKEMINAYKSKAMEDIILAIRSFKMFLKCVFKKY